MTAYFCWIKSRIGVVAPQLFYEVVPKRPEDLKILTKHQLTEADYEAVRVQSNGRSALDILAEKYPPPADQ
jgi:hypothetical protein